MNILIIDDQKDVVESVKGCVDWGSLSVEHVFTGCSAAQARQIMSENQVDILLCDIEMPRENGLELFRWTKIHYPLIECIFLTSHAEFTYAKEALQLGSFGYILQPARSDEVEEAVRGACLRIVENNEVLKLKESEALMSKQRDLLVDGVFNKIFNLEDMETEKLLSKIRVVLRETYSKPRFCPAMIQITRWKTGLGEWETGLVRHTMDNVLSEVFAEYGFEVLFSQKDKNHFFLLISHEQSDMAYEQIQLGINSFFQFIMDYMEFDIALYLGKSDISLQLYEAMPRLMELEKNNIMLLAKVFHDSGHPESGAVANETHLLHMEQWESWLESGKGQFIRREIQQFMENIQKKGQEDARTLKKLHNNFSKTFFCVLGKIGKDSSEVFDATYTYEQYMTAGNTYQDFMQALDFIFAFFEGAGGEETEQDQVDRAIRYIRTHLDKNISRAEVADYVYLNAEYFSRLFKRKTGYVLRDFILKEKVDYAKRLLDSTNLSVSIIASKVGYQNFSHFSKVFRRMEGVAPQEYRQQKQEGIE